jgi:hypothetical protein
VRDFRAADAPPVRAPASPEKSRAISARAGSWRRGWRPREVPPRATRRLDDELLEVDEPVTGNAGLRVERKLQLLVLAKRRVSDLHDEQRAGDGIAEFPARNHRNVGFGSRESPRLQAAVRQHVKILAELLPEDPRDARGHQNVEVTLGAHSDELPVEQLDALVLEDSLLDEPFELDSLERSRTLRS